MGVKCGPSLYGNKYRVRVLRAIREEVTKKNVYFVSQKLFVAGYSDCTASFDRVCLPSSSEGYYRHVDHTGTPEHCWIQKDSTC
jgi:hypothetical protein